MLEDKEPKNAQDWHDQVSTFVKGVVSLRAKKTSAKDIARVLKDRSFEELLGYPSCRVLENLEKSQFKAEAPHSPILEQFEDIYKQATQLNVAIQAIDPQTISENEARELITNIVELKLCPSRIDVLKDSLDHLASHENTIAEEVTKIMKEMEPSSDVAISIKEIDAVLASKKGKKKFSEEDLKRLQEQKTLLERAKATLEPILNKPYFELDQSLISNLSQQISVVGILIDEIPNLLLKCEIKARTREIILSIQDQASIMCEDNPNTSQGLKNTVEAAIMSSTGKISMETILENKNRVREIVKKLKIRDENLKHGLERVESLQWMNEAYGLLSKEKVSEKLLDDHLNGASDSVKQTDVYDNLINRLNLEQSTGPELLEKDFQASIVAIFNKGERLGENKEELIRFIEKTKRRNISEKIRKSVKILEDIIEIYDKDPYSQCEILNDKLFHLKLYETNVYNHLDQVFKALEKINVEVAIITQNSARHKKQIDGQNSKSAMGLLRDMEKIDYVKAREIYKSLNLLPGYLKRQFDEFLADFMDKLEMCDKYTNRIKELKLKYAKTKIFTIKVDPLIAEFEKTVMEYCRLEFSNEEHKRDLEKYAWVVRCNAALEGRIYDGSGLTLESWKKLLDNVSDWGGSFASAVEKKYNTARMFVKEVERIKEWMSSQRGDKSSLPTLEKAEAMLRELNKSAKEVDVSLEKNTLEGIMAGVQTRINSVVSGEKITQHELTSVIEFLKRSPLNLTEEISMLIGKEKKVHEFMVKVRETKPDQLVSRKREINNLYEKLAIKIMDWEEILLNLGNEERVIEKINQLIVAGAKDFEAVQGLRDSYKALKYHRDVKTEIKLMYVYTQLLKTEFEKRQNNAEMNEEMKPIIDYVLLRALVKEGENLLARIKNSEGSLPYDANGLSENVGFIRELCNDTKKFLEHNILGLNIQQLKQRSIEKYYKNFVDISGTIIDHKINLEIQERELAQMEVVHRVEKEVTPKIPSNIIEAKLFKEKDSLLTRAMPAEKRVMTPEKEAPDWGKAVVENVTPRSGNHPFMDEQVAMILKPPAEPMEISDELRNYYIRSWKKQLESNPHLELSAVDIVLEANNLEKTLYKRLKSNPKNYDALCSSITNTLRNVGSFNQDNHAQVHHTRVQGKQSQT